MAKHKQWHIAGWTAVVLAPLAIPVILLILALQRWFGLKSTVDLTPSDVASYLDDFINERGGAWDWDDFTTIPISDPELESIRKAATEVPLPWDADGEKKIKALLKRVQQLI